MRILIFGASGFLGLHLVNFLKKKKVELITCGRNSSNSIKIKNYDKKYLSNLIIKKKPKVIINLVALTDVDLCEQKPLLAKKVNTDIIKSISEIIKKNKLNIKLIHISTDQVYSGNGRKPENKTILLNEYSKSKFNGEKYVLKINGSIIRTNFFGISKTNKNFVDWIIKSNIKKKKKNVFTNIFFSPIYVKSLCRYIYLFCKRNIPGIFNVGSNNCISKSEFAFYLIKKLKLNEKYLIKKKYTKKMLLANRPKNMCMNSKKFEDKFSINTKNCYREIDSMIKEIKK
jgi:dTDP-4-dehydrorhamnose reductase|tara:strand:- start:26 stop:883 length:858 start_codon:yes stop_codon:yes gene_type:complete